MSDVISEVTKRVIPSEQHFSTHLLWLPEEMSVRPSFKKNQPNKPKTTIQTTNQRRALFHGDIFSSESCGSFCISGALE